LRFRDRLRLYDHRFAAVGLDHYQPRFFEGLLGVDARLVSGLGPWLMPRLFARRGRRRIGDGLVHRLVRRRRRRARLVYGFLALGC
jgi:hypothetical protein